MMFWTVKLCSYVSSLLNYSSPLEETVGRKHHPQLEDRIDSVVTIFADNLSHSDKEIRISTLKILCHYKFLAMETPSAGQMAAKKRKIEVSQISSVDSPSNVCISHSMLISFFISASS